VNSWLSTRRRFGLALIGLLAVMALVSACGGDDAGNAEPATNATASPAGESHLNGSITVFAAASLTDAFNEIGKAFEAANADANVVFNFAGSAALRAQIEQGAPVDVFASANTSHMDALVEAKLTADPTVFVQNSLVVITPKDNPANLHDLADLARPGLKLVLAAEEVPVGGYARDILAKADADADYGTGFSAAVLRNLVSNESNVKQVVAKAQLGEADVGIVYGSDVTPDVAPNLQTIQVPKSVNVIADYPIAVLQDARNPDVAQAFVDFVLSTEGQTILAKWGFSAV
jgi:molybdate transport system substrate-binding protein